MNQEKHLTDQLLIQIIEDEHLNPPETEVEAHITNCKVCQSRLEQLADSNWLNEHREKLAKDYASESSAELQLQDLVGTAAFGAGESDIPCRNFDLLAMERMLDELLLPPTHPETLGRLGSYEVEKILGYGGMGLVLRAYDRELQRPVAIKLIIPRLSQDGTAKQRFTREARAAAAILHPNVIAIHGIDEVKGIPWFVMPLINGPSLRELVEQKGPLNERDIVRIGLQIASGLSAAHSHGVIHRDIKPENILVDNQINRVVITDFGLARREFDATLTQAGVLAGTLNYMSPEQACSEDLDARSDLFSLGALLYFLATGTAPFKSDSAGGIVNQVINGEPQDARKINPEISATLARTIKKLLEKNREHRFQTAAEMEDYLAKLVSHLNQPTQFDLPALPHDRRINRSGLFAGLAGVIVLAGMIVWSNTLKPVEPTAKELWKQIQEGHNFESPSDFDDRMKALDSDVDRLQRQIYGAQSQIDESFEIDLRRLNQSAQRLSELLDFGEFD